MARARNIKPGFFRNADLVELPVETRMLFIGLWTLADREGRLEDRPKQIKMEIYPSDSFDVGSMLGQLHAAGFINRYEVESSKFIEIQNFIKHQDPHYKEKASEIPPPPGQENFMMATGVTRTQRQRILDRDGNECKSCGATESLCMDHILPVSRGGDSSDGNLQVLCSACNTKKGNKIDGEEKNSRQRRVNVGSNSIQRNDASPSEPGFLTPDSGFLTPDSGFLTPDSGFLNPEPNTPIPPSGAESEVIPAKQKTTAVSFPAWMESIKATGEKPVPEDDPVFSYATQVGIPPEHLRLCWREFRDRYSQPGAKRYRDWRSVFRKAVRGNWLKLWWIDGDGAYSLTTTGKQAEKAAS